jgi:hypothetical protein
LILLQSSGQAAAGFGGGGVFCSVICGFVSVGDPTWFSWIIYT